MEINGRSLQCPSFLNHLDKVFRMEDFQFPPSKKERTRGHNLYSSYPNPISWSDQIPMAPWTSCGYVTELKLIWSGVLSDFNLSCAAIDKEKACRRYICSCNIIRVVILFPPPKNVKEILTRLKQLLLLMVLMLTSVFLSVPSVCFSSSEKAEL